jgi:hypothetical protein
METSSSCTLLCNRKLSKQINYVIQENQASNYQDLLKKNMATNCKYSTEQTTQSSRGTIPDNNHIKISSIKKCSTKQKKVTLN